MHHATGTAAADADDGDVAADADDADVVITRPARQPVINVMVKVLTRAIYLWAEGLHLAAQAALESARFSPYSGKAHREEPSKTRTSNRTRPPSRPKSQCRPTFLSDFIVIS